MLSDLEISSFIGGHLEQVPFPVHIPPVAVESGFSKGLLIVMAPKEVGSASLLKIGNEHGSNSGAWVAKGMDGAGVVDEVDVLSNGDRFAGIVRWIIWMVVEATVAVRKAAAAGELAVAIDRLLQMDGAKNALCLSLLQKLYLPHLQFCDSFVLHQVVEALVQYPHCGLLRSKGVHAVRFLSSLCLIDGKPLCGQLNAWSTWKDELDCDGSCWGLHLATSLNFAYSSLESVWVKSYGWGLCNHWSLRLIAVNSKSCMLLCVIIIHIYSKLYFIRRPQCTHLCVAVALARYLWSSHCYRFSTPVSHILSLLAL